MIISLTILVLVLAVFFTWTNGFQHSSAVAAAALGSHTIRNRTHMCVLICVFEIAGTILGGSAVANMVRSLSSWPNEPTILPLLCSALSAAIVWNYLSRHIKMPASSTHALIGGIIGALFAGSNSFEYIEIGKFDPVHPTGIIGGVLSLFLSPFLGFALAYIVYSLALLALYHRTDGKRVRKYLMQGQWFTTAALAFGDGQNDTQKTMGLVVIALNAAGFSSSTDIPLWLRVVLGLSMGLGAFWFSEGVAKELAYGIAKLRPLKAIVSETSASAVLIANSIVGGPVSASQVIATSIMGTGTAKRPAGVHWPVIKNIALSWLVTIPASALLGTLIEKIFFQWTLRFL